MVAAIPSRNRAVETRPRWTGNAARAELGHYEDSFLPQEACHGVILKRLQQLKELPPNWDGYGAVPVSAASVELVLELLSILMRQGVPIPSLVPVCTGGIQIEWHAEEIDLEIETLAGGKFGVDFVDHDPDSSESWEGVVRGNWGVIRSFLERMRERRANRLSVGGTR